MAAGWQCDKCGLVEGSDQVTVPVNQISRSLLLLWFSNVKEKEVPVEVSAICHHCGKSLCQKDRILVLDNAFSFDEEKIREHLPSFWPKNTSLKANKHFRKLESFIMLVIPYLLYLLWRANLDHSYTELKAKAYHCEECWEKYHQ